MFTEFLGGKDAIVRVIPLNRATDIMCSLFNHLLATNGIGSVESDLGIVEESTTGVIHVDSASNIPIVLGVVAICIRTATAQG
jgi:hypothetical protein